MIKNFSIKKGLFAIAGLQIFLTLAFLLYLISFNTYQSYNTATNRYYQVGEQLLSTAESMIGDLENATFFPAQLYTQNNDSYLCRTLREGPILKNYRFYSYFNTHAQSSLSSDSVSFIALYDLEQNGVVSSRKEGYRIVFRSDDTPAWYQELSQYKTGSTLLIPANEFSGSGYNQADCRALCVARGVVDLNTIKIVGYCVAGTNTDYLDHRFDQIRQAPNQKYALLKNGQLLYSTMNNPPPSSLIPGSPFPDFQGRKLLLDKGKGYVYNTISHANGYCLILQTPMSDILGNVSSIQFFYTLIIGILLGLIVFLMIRIMKKILSALDRLIDACNRFEPDQGVSVSPEGLPLELSTLFGSFNQMAERIRFLIQEVLLKQQQQQETELQLLRTQINPHYLYNTLEIMHMKAYAHQDYDVASMAELLGQNLQFGLRNITKEVSLREELHQLNIYLSILSYHYGDRISAKICIDDDLLDCRILKLVLQPLVENAVIHGIYKSDQILNIEILGYRTEAGLFIQVSDDGCGMTEKQLQELMQNIASPSSDSIGLRNVCKRILLNYGSEYHAQIQSKYGTGTTITLHFPWNPFHQEV